MEAAGYCHLCDRPLPDALPMSGLCRWCEEVEDDEDGDE